MYRFNSRFMVSIFPLLSAFLVSCSDNDSSNTEVSSIDIENAEEIAGAVTTYLLNVDEVELDETISLMNKSFLGIKLISGFSKKSLDFNCDQGNIVLDDSQLEEFPFVVNGDIYDYAFNQCVTEYNSGFSITKNGRRVYSARDVIGMVTMEESGSYDFSEQSAVFEFDLSVHDYTVQSGFDDNSQGILTVVDGDLRIRHEYSENREMETYTSSHYYYSIMNDETSQQDMLTMTNFEFLDGYINDDEILESYKIRAYSGDVSFNRFEGLFNVETAQTFRSDFNIGGFYVGEALVHADNGSSMQIQAQFNSFDVLINLDADGDGIYESTITTNWNDLNLFYNEENE